MPEADFINALKRRRQISITVTGRRSGRPITIPVWFVADEHALLLLPVNGSETQWYRNLEKDRAITIEAGTMRRDLRARLLQDAQAVRDVIRHFTRKVHARGNQALVQRPGRCGPDSSSPCDARALSQRFRKPEAIKTAEPCSAVFAKGRYLIPPKIGATAAPPR